MSESKKYETTPENAERIYQWLTQRGGIAHWESQDLSNPGSWSTPLLDAEGQPMKRPHWSTPAEPSSITTEIADVTVIAPVEVKRFRVSLKLQGFQIVCSDASSRKIREAEERARDRSADKQAWYEFDYASQQAVIYVNGKKQGLAEFLRDKARTALPEESAS